MAVNHTPGISWMRVGALISSASLCRGFYYLVLYIFFAKYSTTFSGRKRQFQLVSPGKGAKGDLVFLFYAV